MLLEIDALELKRGQQTILRNIHLALEAGEIYGLIGPNGAGKSTTIAAIIGLLTRSNGTLRVFGQDPTYDSRNIRARSGVLSEKNGLYSWMTACEYLTFFSRLYGATHHRDSIANRLVQVGLPRRSDKPIGSFSQGMRQRLGLARALIGDPELLILDEPTNGLDPAGRREFHDILLALSKGGTGILICTHLLDDVERLCGRVGILVDGRTALEGDINELLEANEGKPRFELRMSGPFSAEPSQDNLINVVAKLPGGALVELRPGIAPEAAWHALLSDGWPIREIRAAGHRLEDLYFRVIEEQEIHETGGRSIPKRSQ
jgi:ABC-2 type transport system ATP-binding protein